MQSRTFAVSLPAFVFQSLSRVQLFVTSWTSLACHPLSSDFAQGHIQCVGDAIQPSYPLLPASPPAFSLSQHISNE